MRGERFVVLGVARARSTWFRSVAQWAMSGAVPLEFVKCVSVEELRVHLHSGRRYSAALLDAGVPAVDRDLLATARDAACPVLIVDEGRSGRDWHNLGAAGVLGATFERDDLVNALATHGAMIGADSEVGPHDDLTWIHAPTATVIAVCGPGGTGASTAAIALAEQLAPETPGDLVLADLALRAEQAMLHDARDIVPGVQELVEAHRGRRPARDEVRALTFHIETRGYDLLLGLRRARYWSTLRPHAFVAAFESLRASYGAVVCDVTADLESEDHGGSIDVEERNVMARTAVQQADAVVAVGAAGMKGLHALTRVMGDLVDAGVAATRIVPVVNAAPRNPRVRAEMTRSLARLLGERKGFASPVFLPRRGVDAALRDGAAVPRPLGILLAGAVQAALARSGANVAAPPEPQPVVPGSLGVWLSEEAQ